MKKNKASKNTKDKPREPLPEGKNPPPKAATLEFRQFFQDISNSRAVFVTCAILLPFIALASFPSYQALSYDFDIWFHLAYGREYVQNLSWSMDHAQFSWTPARSEWMYARLGSALMYVAHEAIGIHGLFVLHHLVLGLSAGAVLWLARASDVRTGIWLLAALLTAALVLSISGIYIKPEMFSTLLVTLTVVACLRFRMAPGLWILVVMPLIFLFWVNIHGLWFFGLAFVGLFIFISLLEHLFLPAQGMNRKSLVMISAAAGLAIIALAINPDGIAYPTVITSSMVTGLIGPITSLFSDQGATSRSGIDMMTSIVEYQSLWPHLSYSGRPYWTFLAWLMIMMFTRFAGTWAIAWKRTGMADLPVAAVNIAFLLIGMYMARMSLVYAMIWLPSMVFLAWRLGSKPAFPRTGPLNLAMFLLLSGLTAAQVAFVFEDRRWLGFGYQDYIPEKEVAFIMNNHLPGPIFNNYSTGGYMMWAMYPEYKVFIDPRHSPYRGQVYPDYTAIGSNRFPLNNQGLEAFMARYPARIALIHHEDSHLIEWLRRSPDWSLAYFHKNASVLLHREVGTRLGPEIRAVSLSPERFENVSNPRVLGYLFAYYYLLSPHLAVPIHDYYEQNVSDLYMLKKNTLKEMNQRLAGTLKPGEKLSGE